MAFKFSSKDRTIRIYNLCADTREFIGAGDAYIPANTGLPADCTNIAPPEDAKGKGCSIATEGNVGAGRGPSKCKNYTAKQPGDGSILAGLVLCLLT